MPKPGKTAARGYGAEHQRLRRAMLPTAVGSACTRCGLTIERGQAIDLDHSDDREGYTGFAHSICNRAAGGRKGNQPTPLGRPSEDW